MKLAAALLLITAAACAQTSPGDASYRRAESLFEKSQFDAAWSELDRALTLDPNLVPALTLRAKLAMSIARYDVARASLDRAIATDPNAWYARFLLGFLFYRQNRVPEAAAALQQACKLNPADPRSALYLGMTEETLGRTREAGALYQEAIRLEEVSGKPHAEPWIVYARLLMTEGALDAAGKLLDRALRIEPASRDVHFEHARWLLKKGSPAESAAEGEAALKLTGEIADRQIHFLLVQAYQSTGRTQDAARHAERIRAAESGK